MCIAKTRHKAKSKKKKTKTTFIYFYLLLNYLLDWQNEWLLGSWMVMNGSVRPTVMQYYYNNFFLFFFFFNPILQ